MSDLPQGWEWARLEDLAANEPRAITDGPFGSNLKSEHYRPSGARVLRLQNIGDGYFRDEKAYIELEHFEKLRAYEAREGDLLIASLGDDPPRACLVPKLHEPAIVKADCIRVRLSPRIEPLWVMYALLTPAIKAYAANLIKGVGRPRLGLSQIRSIPIPIPPRNEQLRIVEALEDHLSRLESGASTLSMAVQRLHRLAAAIIAAGSSGALTGVGELATTQLPDVGLNDGALPPLPRTWYWTRLYDIAEVVSGITKDAKKQADVELMEVPYLRVANVQRGRIDLTTVATIRAPKTKIEQLALRPGDVLLNEGGDRDKLARGWIWEGQLPLCIHQNHVFRARIRDGVLDPRILAWHANSFGKAWAEANGKQSVNLASISLSKIRLMPVPVPPKGEQELVARTIQEQVDGVGRLLHAVSSEKGRTRQLRRSLLAEAFAGRLVQRVSNDVPASALLEGIRAERATLQEPKWQRRKHTT